MKNSVICENCNSENAFYKHICTNCGAYIRKRIENIDFWQNAWKIFESPKETFSNIVHADHKNFILVLSLLLGIKLFIVAYSVRSAFSINTPALPNWELNMIIMSISTLFVFLVSSFLYKTLFKLFKIDSRFKDNFAVLIYAFVPFLFAFFFLFPVEYALFGQYMFTFNPSPWVVNSSAAYALSGIEGIMLLWTAFLLFVGMKTQTGSILLAIIFMLLSLGIVTSLVLFSPFL